MPRPVDLDRVDIVNQESRQRPLAQVEATAQTDALKARGVLRGLDRFLDLKVLKR